MQSEEVIKALQPILDQIKRETFVAGYEATNEEAAGIMLSKFFKWDGLSVLEACYSGLEDSNFHHENRTIEKMIKALKGENSEIEGAK